MDARTKKLTDANYSPTIPDSEESIRSQIDGSIQEVYDIVDEAKLDKTSGNYTGSWHGIEKPVYAEPGLAGVVDALSTSLTSHLAEIATIVYPTMTADEIQGIINTTNKIKFADGDFLIDKEIVLRSNITIELSPLTRFKATVGSFATDVPIGFFTFTEVNNVTFKGDLHIEMNKAEYTAGESRHAIRMRSAKDIHFDNVFLSGSGGDGIFMGSFSGTERIPCENITFKIINVDNCRRNGVSFVNVKDFYADKIIVKNMNGTNPQAGIDFEPNNPLEYLQNIYIGEVISLDHVGSGIDFAIGYLKDTANAISITIDSINTNRRVRFAVNTTEILTQKMLGSITINKLFVHDSPEHALSLQDYSIYAIDIFINEMIVRDSNKTVASASYNNAVITSYNGSWGIQSKIGCLTINNLNVSLTANSKAAYLLYFGGAIDHENINIYNIITNKPELGIVAQQTAGTFKYASPTIFYSDISLEIAKYVGMIVANTSANSRTYTLPPAAKNEGQIFTVLAYRGGVVLQTVNNEVILGIGRNAETKIVSRVIGNKITLLSTGEEWIILEKTTGFVPQALNEQDVLETKATAIPTTGTYAVGDIVWNSTPTAGAYLGWVCVTAGTPGTWKGFGTIQS